MALTKHSDLPVIVAGGGPAGLMASAEAALAGCPVILLEKKPAPGRKLLITGSGRCNVTNTGDPARLAEHFFSGGPFLRSALSQFSNRDLIAMMRESGIRFVQEPEGKLFPESGQAGDILEFLVERAQRSGVRIVTGETVRSITKTHDPESVGPGLLNVTTDKQTLSAAGVVLAMGGRSWPNTGSTGDGTRLAADLGHRIIPERPGLVPMVVSDPALHALSGIALRDIRLSLMISGKRVGETSGDLLFTHFGVSGPAVLRLSRLIPFPFPVDPVSLAVDLLPDQHPEIVDRQLLDLLAREPRKKLRNALPALFATPMASAVVPHLIRLSGLDEDPGCSEVSRASRQRLVNGLKALTLPISGTRGWREAIITAGGVDLTEVNPKTMASRLIEGLFFAGEMLDIDADTGGYNLQAAWSTGWVAGRAAASHCTAIRNLL